MGSNYKGDPRRFRVTVPADDEAVSEWIEHQHHLSMSLRMLIRKAIAEGGMRDFFATESGEIRQKAKPGPKPKDDDAQAPAAPMPQRASEVAEKAAQKPAPAQKKPTETPKAASADEPGGDDGYSQMMRDQQKYLDGFGF